jgi:Mn2+/Fe2+ NRAMP family transporter
MRQVLSILLASQVAALVVMPVARLRVSFLSTSRTVMGGAPEDAQDEEGETRLRKLKKGKLAYNTYILVLLCNDLREPTNRCLLQP